MYYGKIIQMFQTTIYIYIRLLDDDYYHYYYHYHYKLLSTYIEQYEYNQIVKPNFPYWIVIIPHVYKGCTMPPN